MTAEEAQRAKAAPLKLNIQGSPNSLAPYFAEEIRRYLEKKYGTDQVHEGDGAWLGLETDANAVVGQPHRAQYVTLVIGQRRRS